MTQAFQPKMDKQVWVHPSAQVIGRVTLKAHANIWPGCVLRADINQIVIGRYTNIQDLTVIHVESERGCRVGDECVIGHRVILHACTVKDRVLIGMGAVVLNHAVIGEGALIGAGSLVTEGARVKPESLYLGAPARYIRKLTKTEVKKHVMWAQKYARLAKMHEAGQFKQV
ncbi:MAG: gamma carbonic anhydrase family protein [Candidatus Omnitrophica bacterium CG11_big_fil_rev_8_21_14_0_20_45_26]|uniref:Gamma carbonic anhydrase family protein n=1 Tax=Candidatus Abzuiibacterium crystallinum TaxID=1974748 RepID=A0A2H0LRE2_9BACT|nr:MAG: gamma carbonic anhydrase family protein [Candidatus Omnitrophica bacterium CG11_big_fil_rev_8_21_14_0_20_45_26]PIW65756.1 MAG: gamma carbonic anhydrase family protein [Candidatus Omnitrophica bacterium CG12_big_fil_rev_8_21_14_0_65_45_16]